MPEVEQHDDDKDHKRDQDDPKTSEDSQKYCPDITELIFFGNFVTIFNNSCRRSLVSNKVLTGAFDFDKLDP